MRAMASPRIHPRQSEGVVLRPSVPPSLPPSLPTAAGALGAYGFPVRVAATDGSGSRRRMGAGSNLQDFKKADGSVDCAQLAGETRRGGDQPGRSRDCGADVRPKSLNFCEKNTLHVYSIMIGCFVMFIGTQFV